jgi:hypothetical protein
VRFTEFARDPDRHIDDIRRTLAVQPANEQLAAEVWGDEAISLDELEDLVAPGEAETVNPAASPPSTSVAVLEEALALTDPDFERLQHAGSAEPRIGGQETLPFDANDESDDALRFVDVDRGRGGRADTWAAGADDARAERGDEATLPASSQPEALELNPDAYAGAHLHEVPLALLPQQIAMVVAERGAVDDDEIADAYAERFGIEVPRNRRRLLTSFAWSAGGRKFIKKDGDRWIPSTVAPHPIEHIGSWTLTQIEQLVRELLENGAHEDDLFERVLGIVWTSDHRVPRPVTKAVGSAIYSVVGRRR